jgi:hypothetical protein
VWTSRESDWLVASGEFDVEPRHKRVNVVGAAHGELEGQREGEVGDGAGVEIEGEDGARVGNDGLELDGVDEGFGEGGEFERCVVEAVDVIPDWRLTC